MSAFGHIKLLQPWLNLFQFRDYQQGLECLIALMNRFSLAACHATSHTQISFSSA